MREIRSPLDGIPSPFAARRAVSGAVLLADTSGSGSPDDNVLAIDFVSDGVPSAYVQSTSGALVLAKSAVTNADVLAIDFTTDGTIGGPSAYIEDV